MSRLDRARTVNLALSPLLSNQCYMPQTPPSSATQALSPPPPGSPPQLYGMGPAVEEPSSPTPNVVAPRHLGKQRNKGDLKNLLQRFKSVQHDINVLVNELEEIVDN